MIVPVGAGYLPSRFSADACAAAADAFCGLAGPAFL
jgi:hypothetical protein